MRKQFPRKLGQPVGFYSEGKGENRKVHPIFEGSSSGLRARIKSEEQRIEKKNPAEIHVIEKGVPILAQNEFYHGSAHKKTAEAIAKEGFDLSKIGEATARRQSGITPLFLGSSPTSGSGIYLAKDKETAERYGKYLVKVTMKPGAKILDVQPYWLTGDKAPPELPILKEIEAWYPDYIRRQRMKNLPEESEEEREKIVERVQAGLPEMLERINPHSGFQKFSVNDFQDTIRSYAKDKGYAGVNWDSTDTVLFDNSGIKSIEYLKKDPPKKEPIRYRVSTVWHISGPVPRRIVRGFKDFNSQKEAQDFAKGLEKEGVSSSGSPYKQKAEIEKIRYAVPLSLSMISKWRSA